MEWYIVVLFLLLVVLTILLGVLIVCYLGGQRCTISIQQRVPNHELTKIQQEEEQKRQKKFSSKIKRAFHSKEKTETPLKPVEDVKTVELTFKLGDKPKTDAQTGTTDEAAVQFIPVNHVTEAELLARQKKRDEIRKKYNI